MYKAIIVTQMADSNRNHIYIYDAEKEQIISIDAETGERIDQKQSPVHQLLAYLNEYHKQTALRKFTIWCARETNPHFKPIQKRCLEVAERSLREEANKAELQELYDKTEGAAISIDTVGLRRDTFYAAGFLASRECVNPDLFEGAKNAARYHSLWEERKSTRQETQQKQIDYLLDLIASDNLP